MASLYITEYAGPGNPTGSVPSGQEPSLADQKVTIGATSTQSSALQNNTQIIRLHTDVICSVAIGSNPTATASTRRLPANATEYFYVPLSSGYKVAVITNT